MVEACVVALVSHFLLGLPWVWGFILGFVLAAVSPAVVVPSMLLLQREGYGVEKLEFLHHLCRPASPQQEGTEKKESALTDLNLTSC
ncbi:sodium/hydrogen exchanger 9B2-like [Pholidichthys leucotaenia]